VHSEDAFDELRHTVPARPCVGAQSARIDPAAAEGLRNGHLDLLGLGAGLSRVEDGALGRGEADGLVAPHLALIPGARGGVDHHTGR
jgi:hypothetical protein